MIVIVGAGLAGLTAGRALLSAGYKDFVIIDKAGQVGGRVATETDGEFLYDVGFAVLNPAYPMVEKYLVLPELALEYFDAGALLLHGGGHKSALYDPFSHPKKLLPMIAQSFPAWSDRLRTIFFRLNVKIPDRPKDDGMTALEKLKSIGFSESYIEKFFRPFFAGVFLDRDLSVSDELFCYLFNYFKKSRVAVPFGGMNAVALNLASQIPEENFRLNIAAESIEKGKIFLSDGTSLRPETVIIAVDESSAANLDGQKSDVPTRSVTTFYFAAESLPWQERLLALNSSGSGWVNHLAVLSNIQPSYSKKKRHLVAVSGVGSTFTKSSEQTQKSIKSALVEFLGSEASDWEYLRHYHIEHALPVRFRRQPYQSEGLIYAGDYLENPSIQGAMLSGEKAAKIALSKTSSL